MSSTHIEYVVCIVCITFDLSEATKLEQKDRYLALKAIIRCKFGLSSRLTNKSFSDDIKLTIIANCLTSKLDNAYNVIDHTFINTNKFMSK